MYTKCYQHLFGFILFKNRKEVTATELTPPKQNDNFFAFSLADMQLFKRLSPSKGPLVRPWLLGGRMRKHEFFDAVVIVCVCEADMSVDEDFTPLPIAQPSAWYCDPAKNQKNEMFFFFSNLLLF